jgi:hypothetical protein
MQKASKILYYLFKMFFTFSWLCTAIVILPLLGSCLALSPDDRIPEEWRSTIPLAWDSAMTRSRFMSGNNFPDQHIWTLDQIMDGEGYAIYWHYLY